jgi:hypothetical protein
LGKYTTLRLSQQIFKEWRLTAIIPTTQETEIQRIVVQGQHGPKKQLMRSYLNQKAGHGGVCCLMYLGGINRRIAVQATCAKKRETLFEK